VLAVARGIGQAMDGERIVITKSTVPVGTAARVRAAIESETTHPVHVGSNPEFLKEGAAIDDFMKPDRIVCGVESERAQDVLARLYKPFTLNGHPVLFMDIPSAEMTKYAANAMLATRISFMNEVANVCELYGANVDEVRRAIASDLRIGSSFLFPGVGYGGSCFPKDVKAILKFAGDKDYDFKILGAVEEVNQRQKKKLVDLMKARLGSLKGKTIAVWGLAFKPRTDDMREAPARTIIEGLLAAGATVQAFDPEATETAQRIFGDRITYAKKSYEALAGADALALVTEWSEFREPDFARMKKVMRQPVIFDGRNIYNPETVRAQGFTYVSIGR
jgi:UDPglucose 6-dehydrogenase